ncbi:MAG TPA: hypothetical protein VHM00_10500 [Caldimonas sp.]|jgi:hypothetical protein|nr:hypothetical protein [Caldimonas sp.]HEX2541499.1 hypothetical protein [Caldimonas sp.]
MTKPINDRLKSADRDAAGRFALGNTASPGRPPGRGVVSELRQRLAADLDPIIDQLRTQALAGDPQAIRIILDRVIPSLRPVELPAMLRIPPTGSLADQADAVMQAVAAGELAPGQAAQIVSALGAVAKIMETTELVRRIEALEAGRSSKSGIA